MRYILFSLALVAALFSLFFFSQSLAETKKTILVGSPIRQHPAVLKEFLTSLDELEKETFTLSYFFVDDNDDLVSKQLLAEFAKAHPNQCTIVYADEKDRNSDHFFNEFTHIWTNQMVWKVAAFKDGIIEHAKNKNYDYLFLIDSDLVLHPKTMEKLLEGNKGILCNIFWTSWQPGAVEMPQVWVQDVYEFYEREGNEELPENKKMERFWAFANQLREPGIYEVGGLGACTLIDRESLLKGVSFKKIKNLSFWGEDRHFCVRAVALGIPLYVDTHYPAYHIYRPSALPGVEAFKAACRNETGLEPTNKEERIEKVAPAAPEPRITLSMVMKNEGDRYLRKVLEAAKPYITNAVIIDDGSTDQSVEIVKEVLTGIPLQLILNKDSKFAQECSLREQQWNETIKTNPDWILNLDADEIFEDRFKDEVKQLIADPSVDAYYFRLYDFWDENHYRDDAYWQAHNVYRPFLVRYKPEQTYSFKQMAQHCGRFPTEVQLYPNAKRSDLRLKHYGWAREDDRIAKYDRYQRLDPDARYGWKEQYESILDPQPHIVEWKE